MQVRARAPALWVSRPDSAAVASAAAAATAAEAAWMKGAGPLRPALVRQQLFFPDRNLIQYDCGKLQVGTFACTVWSLDLEHVRQVQQQRFCQTATSSSATAAAVALVASVRLQQAVRPLWLRFRPVQLQQAVRPLFISFRLNDSRLAA